MKKPTAGYKIEGVPTSFINGKLVAQERASIKQ
jgi:hypothetical protein